MMLYYEIFHIYQHGKPLAMSAQTRQESMFREFLFLVSQHYVREREIGYYADQMCVTPKYLSSVVRTGIGQQRGVVDQPHGHHAREKPAQNQSPAQPFSRSPTNSISPIRRSSASISNAAWE